MAQNIHAVILAVLPAVPPGITSRQVVRAAIEAGATQSAESLKSSLRGLVFLGRVQTSSGIRPKLHWAAGDSQ